MPMATRRHHGNRLLVSVHGRGLSSVQALRRPLRCDAILDCGEARWRVQIKSTCSLCRENVYRVRTSRTARVPGHRKFKAVSYAEF